MDIFDNPNYRLNKSMLSFFGQWPLQSRKERYLLRTTTVIIVGSLIIPEMIKLVEYLGDMNGMIECLPALALHLRFISKFMNCIFNAKKMEALTIRIKENWALRTADFEIDILSRYAERGRLVTLLYTGYLSCAHLMFLSVHLIPIILDIIAPLNETRERKYPYETEYFLEKDEKYFLVWAHAWFGMSFAVGMILASDSMFTVYVHHVCSIFAMLGVRLEKIGRESKNDEKIPTNDDFSRNRDKTYEDIVDCIKIHKEAVNYSSLLESSGCISYFFVVGVSMLSTTLTGYMTVINLDHPREALRFGGFAIGEVIHLFYLCWQGHALVEHSENIFVSAYNVNWYDLSPRAKKLLILIMMRSTEPCKLTAGKIYGLSMENFAAAMKTSMSYFTILLSMQ